MADAEKEDPDLELVSALILLMGGENIGRQARVIKRAFSIHLLDETGERATQNDLSAALIGLEDAMKMLDPSSIYGNYPMGHVAGSNVLDKLKATRAIIIHAREMLYQRLRRTLP